MDRIPDTTIKIGDRVRSYDFEHNDDCYYEGVVNGIIMGEGSARFTCNVYRIQVQRQVWDGMPVPKNCDVIYPPMNGVETTFGGITAGVVKI